MARTDPLPPFSAPSPAPIASSFSPASFSSSFNSSYSASSVSSLSSYDPFLDLGRLLARLEQNLLRADSDRWRRLVADEFQRLQARFDVAAARKLLTRVEQSALSVKVLARRQEIQAELNRRRALIEQLQERLDDLDEEARTAAAMRRDDDDDDDEDEYGTDEELAHVHTRSANIASREAAQQQSEQVQPSPETDTLEASFISTADSSTAPSFTSTTSTGRPRRRKTGRVRIAAPTDDAGASTTASVSMDMRSRKTSGGRRSASSGSDTARTTSAQVGGDDAGEKALLFGRSGEDSGDGVVAEEAVLDHHRREQELLSEDILRLAQALKEKSLTTSRMLEDDKDVVDRVGDGLNTTTDSLSAASRSMAMLTRMTEGKGWWGRMMLLGMVYGLMAVLVLMFLFLPKLRF